jgi:hypothetical protein
MLGALKKKLKHDLKHDVEELDLPQATTASRILKDNFTQRRGIEDHGRGQLYVGLPLI